MSKRIYLPFVNAEPISDLPVITTLEPGNMLIETPSGEAKRISTEVFQQLLHKIAVPINPTDSGPFSVNTWYKPMISSSGSGTNYPNANNLKAVEGIDTLFYYTGTTWLPYANKLPQATQYIAPFDSSTFPITGPAQRTYNNAIWELSDGITAQSTDIPGISDKWKNIAVNTEYLDGKSIEDDPSQYGSTNLNLVGVDMTSQGYYVFRVEFTEDKIIDVIRMHTTNPSTINFVIGTIEQAGRFVEVRSFQKTTVVGYNDLQINEILKVGEFIAIKTPGKIPDYQVQVDDPNYWWATDQGYNTALIPWNNWKLSFQMTVRTIVLADDFYIKNSQLSPINQEIQGIKLNSNVLISPNGTKYKLTVNDAGALATQRMGGYKVIGHAGNSILRHPIMSYWWGDWGMAASTRENDYNHRLLAMIKTDEPTATTDAMNWAAWELNPSTYDKSNFDSYLTSKPFDLFIIRFGENATYNSNYKQNYKDLVLYVKSKLPDNCRIIIGGQFWANSDKETAMSQVADELGLTFVSMAGLDIPANKSFIGDTVQGDDGQSHTVDNSGVANHPNNNGMLAIAQRLFSAL